MKKQTLFLVLSIVDILGVVQRTSLIETTETVFFVVSNSFIRMTIWTYHIVLEQRKIQDKQLICSLSCATGGEG